METKLLKEVLSVPTKTYRETMMINFLVNYLHEKKYEYYLDGMNNVYITKQTDDVEYFPCVVAHTDTVHNIDTINIVEEQLPNEQGDIKLALKAYNNDNQPTGIGGDDKCGVFACLTLLDQLPNLKVALFVSEETGCHGSLNADDEFFENVGYVIEFDAPGNSMVTEYCWGVQLFDRDGDFFNVCDEVLTEGFNSRNDYQSHPYTDVMALKRKYNFSCINFAIGYYNYHTKHEYVVVEDVFNGIKTGKNMIEKLGNKLYPLKSILV
jgi:tripeptide aminopeptidase